MKFTKLFQNGCQGFSMHPYPVESPDGGELLVELLIKNTNNKCKKELDSYL